MHWRNSIYSRRLREKNRELAQKRNKIYCTFLDGSCSVSLLIQSFSFFVANQRCKFQRDWFVVNLAWFWVVVLNSWRNNSLHGPFKAKLALARAAVLRNFKEFSNNKKMFFCNSNKSKNKIDLFWNNFVGCVVLI